MCAAVQYSVQSFENYFLCAGNWTRQATLVLIEEYKKNAHKFRDIKVKKKNIWEDIASVLKEQGYYMTGKQVEGRWKTITASYRQVVDNNNTSGKGRRTCAFFDELSEVYGYRPNVRPRVLYDNNRRQCDPQAEPQPSTSSEPAACSKQPSTDSTSQPSRKKQKSSKKDTYLDWLKEEAEVSRKEEEKKLLEVQKQHQEKMVMFKGCLEVFKSWKQLLP